MSILDFDKIIYHYKILNSIIENKKSFPVHATLSLGNFCNHKCLWCSVYQTGQDKPVFINMDRLLKFLRKARQHGLKAVTYIGNGEPSAHPQFKELVRAVGSMGLEQGMFTNGYLLNRSSAEILDLFTWVRVSLDAGTPEMHELVHDVPDQFNTIINNIINLTANRKQIGQPAIGVQFAVHQINISDLSTAAKIAKTSGADYFSVKPVFNRGSVEERIEKNTLTEKEISDAVKNIIYLADSSFKIFYRPHQANSNIKEKNILPYDSCCAGFYNLYVYDDETLGYCGPNRIGCGTIEDEPENIAEKILSGHSKLNLDACPAGCRYHSLNNLIYQIKNENPDMDKHANFI